MCQNWFAPLWQFHIHTHAPLWRLLPRMSTQKLLRRDLSFIQYGRFKLLRPLGPREPLNPLLPLLPRGPRAPRWPRMPRGPRPPVLPRGPLAPLVPLRPLNPLTPRDPLGPRLPLAPFGPRGPTCLRKVLIFRFWDTMTRFILRTVRTSLRTVVCSFPMLRRVFLRNALMRFLSLAALRRAFLTLRAACLAFLAARRALRLAALARALAARALRFAARDRPLRGRDRVLPPCTAPLDAPPDTTALGNCITTGCPETAFPLPCCV